MSAPGRRFALLLVLLACVLPLGVAQARDGVRERDNVATAVTEQDGASTFDLAWEVRKERGGVIDNLNTAQAGAKCTDCRATAIAFQIVLVSGNPDQVAPVNRSLAYTDQCTRCIVYAGARQFVRVVDGRAKFDRDGRAELRDVRRDLAALEGQELTADQLAAAVDAQKARVLDVLQNDVVLKANPHEQADELDQQDSADDDVS